MSNYSILRISDESQIGAFHLLDWEWNLRNGKRLYSTLPVLENIEPLTVEYPVIKKLQYDFLDAGPIRAISERVVRFLENKINAEYIPIKGMHEGKTYTDNKFFVLHLLDRYEAMDLEKSVYTKWPIADGGGFDRVNKLVLNESDVNQSPIFMLDEFELICVRNDLCTVLLAENFRGFKFIASEEYTNSWC